jgi:hypothetical protein
VNHGKYAPISVRFETALNDALREASSGYLNEPLNRDVPAVAHECRVLAILRAERGNLVRRYGVFGQRVAS